MTSSVTSAVGHRGGRVVGAHQVHDDRQGDLVHRDLLADRHVADDDLGDLRRPERRQAGHVQLEDDAAALVAVRVAELRLHAARDRHLGYVVQDREHLDLAPGRTDLDAHVLGDEREQVVELLGEDAGRGVGRRREVGATAARVGHRREQVLVEARRRTRSWSCRCRRRRCRGPCVRAGSRR